MICHSHVKMNTIQFTSLEANDQAGSGGNTDTGKKANDQVGSGGNADTGKTANDQLTNYSHVSIYIH